MRILFDACRSVGHFTGIGRIVDGLLNTLLEVDHENQYLVLHGENDPLKGKKAPNFETRRISFGLNPMGVNLILPALAYTWHADVAYFPFWLMPLCLPCHSVVAIHDLITIACGEHFSRPYRWGYALYSAFAARVADRIHTLSFHSQADLIQSFGIPSQKVDVIYIDADPVYHPRLLTPGDYNLLARCGLAKPFVLYVGNHKPHKNLCTLLKVYESIEARIESDLVIVGARANYKDPFSLPYGILADELGLRSRVHFLGQIGDEELATLYNAARFFVFPSLYEGFGLPPLEAMRCGTPVACSNTTSLPEVVGDAALTFDPLDDRQVAETMLRLDKSAELRAKLSVLGLERSRLFSWQESTRKWLASMEKAVEEGKRMAKPSSRLSGGK